MQSNEQQVTAVKFSKERSKRSWQFVRGGGRQRSDMQAGRMIISGRVLRRWDWVRQQRNRIGSRPGGKMQRRQHSNSHDDG